MFLTVSYIHREAANPGELSIKWASVQSGFSSFNLFPDFVPLPTSLISTAQFCFYFFSLAHCQEEGLDLKTDR